MTKLSITAAWNETSAFVRGNAGSLFTIAFALIALPTVIMQALMPIAARSAEAEGPGLWMLLVPVVLVLSVAGSLAISALALGRESVIGSAIARGFRRCLPAIGAVLLIALAGALLATPIIIAMGVNPAETSPVSEEAAGRVALAMLLLLPILLFFWVRLLLMTPVAANEAVGPIGIIRRSWQLTRGNFWRLLGFLLLILIAFIVVSLVLTMLAGVIIALAAGRPDPGSLAGLLMLLVAGLLNAAFAVVFTSFVARIYVQLSGGATSGN